jgi:hypothetical protein
MTKTELSFLEELKKNLYFITTKEQEDFLAKQNRFLKVLIRCSNGRFSCAIQDLPAFVELIKDNKQNYIRDVSVLDTDFIHGLMSNN